MGRSGDGRADEIGIPIAAGTDREHFVDGHPAVLAELEVLVKDVGFTPLEALTAATRTGRAGRRHGEPEPILLRDEA